MGRVAGRVAIITGAASAQGLGFATAAALAFEGAAVVLTDIDETGARAAADRISSTGARAIAQPVDVSDEAQWRAVVASTVKAFGRVDILVNNAGVVLRGPIASLSAADFRKQLEVNLTGTFLGCTAAIPAMRSGGRGGSIINVSSVAGLVGYPNLAGYNASKGGVRLLTKSIAVECAAEGIRCNSVHPGKIWTGMLETASTAAGVDRQRMADDVPMRRLGKPADIANCIVFLASDEAEYVTGAEFVIDGGLTAQ